jgi:hypothetical protein
MDPYRTAPERPPEPELDRLPVYLRGGLIKGGDIGVMREQLVFLPRFGRPRGVPIERGIRGLGLAEMFAPEELVGPARWSTHDTVETWLSIVASAPYREPLSMSPNEAIIDRAFAFDGGVPDESRSFVIVIDGDRAHLIPAEQRFHECFALPAGVEIRDVGSRTLSRALRWLPRMVLGPILAAVAARVITLDEARLAPPLLVQGRRYLLVADVAIELVRPQIAAIERWLATPSAPP